MDYIKGYMKSVGDFVTSVIDESPGSQEIEAEELSRPSADCESHTEQATDESAKTPTPDSPGFLDWVPKFKTSTGENPLVYCINSLASLGSETEKPDELKVLETQPTSVVQPGADEQTASVTTPPVDPSATETQSPGVMDSDSAFANWLTGLSLRSEEVWKQMKHDFNEVVNVMSTEPKDAMSRTATSLRQHLSAAASAVGKMDPNRFTLLPESQADDPAAVAREPTEPVPAADPPSLTTLRSDVGHFVSGLMSSLFGTGDETDQGATRSKREARLQVLRADPATYEHEPPIPPAHLQAHTYADWRAAYFDESICQPLPGIPLVGSREATTGEDETMTDLLEPKHPSPEELLEQNPFMRTYLSRLVHHDANGMTDGDFWSRYYYRVYLLDVTERRRKLLAKRVESIQNQGGRHASAISTGHEDSSLEVSRDWFEHESEQETTEPVEPTPTKTTPQVQPAIDTSAKKSVPDKKPKRNKRRRNNTDRGLKPSATDATGPVMPVSSKDDVETVKVDPPTVKQQPSKTNGESDETITSCSSSVVVLSNSEEDAELVTTAARPQSGLQSEHDSVEEWGDVCEEDLRELSAAQSTDQRHSSKDDESKPSSDWDMWS